MAKRNGKYAHITAVLPKINGIGADYRENAKYQERVDQTKREILMEPSVEDYMMDEGDIRRTLDHVEGQMKALHRYLLRRCAGQNHATSLAAAYAAARDLKDRIKDWESNTNLLIESYAQLMAEAFDREDLTQLRLGDRPVSVGEEPYSTVKDKAANWAWAIRECEHCDKPEHEHVKGFAIPQDDELRPTQEIHGLFGWTEETDPVTQEILDVAHLFKPNELRKSLQLPWSTLDALVRQRLLAGEPAPPGVEVWAKKKIRLGGGDD